MECGFPGNKSIVEKGMLMNFVIDGVRYHVEEIGEGFPLLMLHGFTGDSASWKVFESQLNSHSKVIAIDIIGHGKSDSPAEETRYDIESVASDINKLLEELGIEQIDILGYSMGGRLGITFAVKYPKKVRRIVLESSSPGLETEEERKARRIQDENLALQIQKDGIYEFVNFWENIPLFRSQKKLPENIHNAIRKQRLNNSKLGLMNSLRGMGTGAQPSWWEELENLNMPILFITGSMDEKFCLIAEKMMKRVKNGHWVSVADCGHAIHVEKPEIFGTIVSGFLSNDKGDKWCSPA